MDPILEVELGEQLDNVVKFKDDRLRSRDCLFKEFETTTDWELDFFTWLVEYAAGLESESAETGSETGTSAISIPSTDSETTIATIQDPVQ